MLKRGLTRDLFSKDGTDTIKTRLENLGKNIVLEE